MKSLQDYYDANTRSAGSDYLVQVAHTENGKAIGEVEFDAMLAQIVTALSLQREDVLLDLCCGNGVFTHRLSSHVKSVTGVDFSRSLLDVASKVHLADNINYYQMDALQVGRLADSHQIPFTKVLIYTALQHFRQDNFGKILDQLDLITHGKAVIYLGYVPDLELKWNLYNTPMRIFQHILRRIAGTERIRHWWSKREMEGACRRRNLSCQFESPPAGTRAAIFRFSAIIRPLGCGGGQDCR